jgi:queuine tRNA-ribosyltransferase
VGEILVLRLLSLHNLHFYGEIVHGARQAIREGRLMDYKRKILEHLSPRAT